MTNREIIELTSTHVANTYARFPVAMVRGEGMRVWDADGREYLDFTSGLAVCNLGHCHPAVVKAIKDQAEKLIHISNLYHIEPQALLAKELTASSFADRAFFCNSGAEAVEAGLKLARKYFAEKKEVRPRMVTMEKSFHGRTFGALAATGQEKIRSGYEPYLEAFAYVPFNDLDAAREAVDEKTAAVLVEPIQGEGGVNVPDEGYLKGLREICDSTGALLIFDEVQVGVGRTGKLFAHEHHGVTPDIMALAKGLAGGVAIGAMLATESVASAFGPGSHASTFGGNPLATAASLAALGAIKEERLLDNCVTVGTYLKKRLETLKEKYPFVREVRGKGFMAGVETEMAVSSIVKDCLAEGLLIISAGEKTLRFLPALVASEADVDEMMSVLTRVLDRVD